MIRKSQDMKVEQIENMRGGNGTITIRHFFSKDEIAANSRLCAFIEIPAGANIGLHKHENEDEVYIVTSGKGILDDGTSRTEINPGDAVLTGNGESHSVYNEGDEMLTMIVVIMNY